MAIDQKDVALEACRKIAQCSTNILKNLDELESVQEQLSSAGIDLSNYSVDIEAINSIKHCEAETYKNIVSVFSPQIVSNMKAYYSGTPTQQGWTALQKARSFIIS